MAEPRFAMLLKARPIDGRFNGCYAILKIRIRHYMPYMAHSSRFDKLDNSCIIPNICYYITAL